MHKLRTKEEMTFCQYLFWQFVQLFRPIDNVSNKNNIILTYKI